MAMRTLRGTRLWFLASAGILSLAAACSPTQRYFGAGGGGGTSTSSGGQGGTQPSGSTSGSGACAEVTSVSNCGACGNDCTKLPNVNPAGVACVAGACSVPADACADGFAHCSQKVEDGCETDIVKDEANCGACGKQCLLGQLCGAKTCTENEVSCVLTGTCVQAFCNDLGHYSVTKDIVVDLKVNRTLWERDTPKTTMNYAAAQTYCANLSLVGVPSGWRVPTSGEIATILYKNGGLNGCPASYCSPALDQSAFLDTVSDEYWTSSPYMPGLNYCMSFCDGRSSPYKEDVTSAHYVRCVHDPLPVPP